MSLGISSLVDLVIIKDPVPTSSFIYSQLFSAIMIFVIATVSLFPPREWEDRTLRVSRKASDTQFLISSPIPTSILPSFPPVGVCHQGSHTCLVTPDGLILQQGFSWISVVLTGCNVLFTLLCFLMGLILSPTLFFDLPIFTVYKPCGQSCFDFPTSQNGESNFFLNI